MVEAKAVWACSASSVRHFKVCSCCTCVIISDLLNHEDYEDTPNKEPRTTQLALPHHRENVPFGHGLLSVPPTTSLNVPAAHRSHWNLPAEVVTEPKGHGTHKLPAVPGGHGSHLPFTTRWFTRQPQCPLSWFKTKVARHCTAKHVVDSPPLLNGAVRNGHCTQLLVVWSDRDRISQDLQSGTRTPFVGKRSRKVPLGQGLKGWLHSSKKFFPSNKRSWPAGQFVAADKHPRTGFGNIPREPLPHLADPGSGATQVELARATLHRALGR